MPRTRRSLKEVFDQVMHVALTCVEGRHRSHFLALSLDIVCYIVGISHGTRWHHRVHKWFHDHASMRADCGCYKGPNATPTCKGSTWDVQRRARGGVRVNPKQWHAAQCHSRALVCLTVDAYVRFLCVGLYCCFFFRLKWPNKLPSNVPI